MLSLLLTVTEGERCREGGGLRAPKRVERGLRLKVGDARVRDDCWVWVGLLFDVQDIDGWMLKVS